MSKLPEARVGTRRVWRKVLLRAGLVGSSAWALVFLVGLGLPGCKNDAITYAKALWPEAKCNALETHVEAGKDKAICTLKGMKVYCSALYGQEPSCRTIYEPRQ